MESHTVIVFQDYAMCNDCSWFYNPNKEMSGKKRLVEEAEKHEEETKDAR